MKSFTPVLGFVAAFGISAAAMADPTTFADYAGLSGNTRNLQVTAGTNSTVITGYSNRGGTASNTQDRLAAYATSGIDLGQVGLVQFEFQNVTGLSASSGGTAGVGSMIATNAFFKNVSSPNTSSSVDSRRNSPYRLTDVGGTIIFKPVGSGVFADGRAFDSDSVLLAITFSDSTLTRGSSGKGFGQDTFATSSGSDYKPGLVSFYSDYLDFGTPEAQAQAQREFSITFQSDVDTGTPGSPTTNKQFRADSVGNFGADPVPAVSTPTAPEASSWAMMVISFGVVGGTMRARKRTLVSATA